MSGRFFITGLPRSRTAWLSVATTTPTSVCCHEPTSWLNSFEELRVFWAPTFGVDIGISDSSLAPQAERILEELAPRTLVIDRPVEDAIRSFINYAARAGISVNEARIRQISEQTLAGLDKVRRHPLVRAVDFRGLDDYAEVMVSVRWLLPDADLPDLKALMTFNIQVAAKHIRAVTARPHNGWHLEAAV